MIANELVHFARVLRTAGLSIGPDRVIAATTALEIVGVSRRDDVHAALSAVMIDRHEQQALFDAAFDAFWRVTGRPGPSTEPPTTRPAGRAFEDDEARSKRPGSPAATRPPAPSLTSGQPVRDEARGDAALTFCDRERLARADFETMTAAEFAMARKLAEQMPLPVDPVRRRRRQAAAGRAANRRIDLRATLQRMSRQPHALLPVYTRPRTEWPTLVVLLDISGSMERYSRLFLHYVHGLTRSRTRVHTLTFGTRLTNITRWLRNRDPDVALKLADAHVEDWKGGTRMASCLDEFNHVWARRLLGASAALLLVSDGLDRGDPGDLSRCAARLRRFAHTIVWLNPLLRYDGFQARAAGVQALLPHVDRFLPVHNLASLADLGHVLQADAIRPGRRRTRVRPAPPDEWR